MTNKNAVHSATRAGRTPLFMRFGGPPRGGGGGGGGCCMLCLQTPNLLIIFLSFVKVVSVLEHCRSKKYVVKVRLRWLGAVLQ